ncbi:brain-specific angiogenesis inhibitor 1-associated protein 2-like [Rhopilema esculentum]|uniref:brain-specific angiogenesis inhibitor 1-associated protein 2-like n=1 Tax=Rhopilema esculentum TaxID=499914 RepID=UPI0031D61024|eukprot:gene8959-16594_t
MEEEINDLHQLSTSVFTNIGGITPNIKNLITSSKAFHRSYQGTILLGTQFIQSLDAFAQSALCANGATKLIGETLKDIISIFNEIEAMKGDLMNLFAKDVIAPLESRAEQEVNMSKLAHKQYLQDNKIQTEVVNKYTQEIVKLRKKSQRRKGKAGKYEKKEEEMLEGLQNSEKKLRELRENGLRRALIGERRIYCFVAEKICIFGKGMAANSKRIEAMLTEKMAIWDKVVSHPDDLPSESENMITNPSSYTTATMKRKDQRHYTISQSRYNTIDVRMNSSRPSVIGRETTEDNSAVDGVEKPASQEAKDDSNKKIKEINNPGNGHISSQSQAMPVNQKLLNGNARFSMIADRLEENELAVDGKVSVQLKAIYDHKGKDNSQLSFCKGDLLDAMGESTGGWQYGANSKTGKSGWFPTAYAEAIPKKPVPSPIIPVIHGSLKDNSPLTQRGKTRRVSTPGTVSLPYIPAPDYDFGESKAPLVNGTKNNSKAKSMALHQSASAPGLTDSQEITVTFADEEPIVIPPPDFRENVNEAPKLPPPADFVTMPFPPPPPDVDLSVPQTPDSNANADDNPFAGIKLKKTITNDRSMPAILPSN